VSLCGTQDAIGVGAHAGDKATHQRVGDKAASAKQEPVAVSLPRTFKFLTDPALPLKILSVGSTLATLIVVLGIGIWTIVGAWNAFRYFVGF
jgi:hypothetical protein